MKNNLNELEKEKIKEYGNYVKKLRKERGWTQKELSLRSNVSEQSICYIENATQIAGYNTVYNIVVGFGMTLSEFFKGLE